MKTLTKTQWIFCFIAEQGTNGAAYKDLEDALQIWDYGQHPGQFLRNLKSKGLIRKKPNKPYLLTTSGKAYYQHLIDTKQWQTLYMNPKYARKLVVTEYELIKNRRYNRGKKP